MDPPCPPLLPPTRIPTTSTGSSSNRPRGTSTPSAHSLLLTHSLHLLSPSSPSTPSTLWSHLRTLQYCTSTTTLSRSSYTHLWLLFLFSHLVLKSPSSVFSPYIKYLRLNEVTEKEYLVRVVCSRLWWETGTEEGRRRGRKVLQTGTGGGIGDGNGDGWELKSEGGVFRRRFRERLERHFREKCNCQSQAEKQAGEHEQEEEQGEKQRQNRLRRRQRQRQGHGHGQGHGQGQRRVRVGGGGTAAAGRIPQVSSRRDGGGRGRSGAGAGAGAGVVTGERRPRSTVGGTISNVSVSDQRKRKKLKKSHQRSQSQSNSRSHSLFVPLNDLVPAGSSRGQVSSVSGSSSSTSASTSGAAFVSGSGIGRHRQSRGDPKERSSRSRDRRKPKVSESETRQRQGQGMRTRSGVAAASSDTAAEKKFVPPKREISSGFRLGALGALGPSGPGPGPGLRSSYSSTGPRVSTATAVSGLGSSIGLLAGVTPFGQPMPKPKVAVGQGLALSSSAAIVRDPAGLTGRKRARQTSSTAVSWGVPSSVPAFTSDTSLHSGPPPAKRRRGEDGQAVGMHSHSAPSLPAASAVVAPIGVSERMRRNERLRNLSAAAALRHSPISLVSNPDDVIVVNRVQYIKLRLIGKGGSSKVFKCLQTDSKRIVAIKRVRLSGPPSIVESFLNEVDMLKRLQSEEHIIRLFDHEHREADRLLFLVMECGEVDLNVLLRSQKKKPFNINLQRLYWQQMLQAVHSIHVKRIVHGDLKPANFLLVRGSVKLIDFGIAKAIQHENTTNIYRDSQVGTLNYISPEALMESHHGGRTKYKVGRSSDVWSLGCILCQMVTGEAPFAKLSPVQKLQAITDPSLKIRIPPQVPPVIASVLHMTLRRDPSKRASLQSLLKHPFVLGESVVSATAASEIATSRGWLSRHRVATLMNRSLQLMLCNRFGYGQKKKYASRLIENIQKAGVPVSDLMSMSPEAAGSRRSRS